MIWKKRRNVVYQSLDFGHWCGWKNVVCFLILKPIFDLKYPGNALGTLLSNLWPQKT